MVQTKRRKAGRPSDPIPRRVLLLEARRVFAEQGYAGASMSRIAERIGVRKPTLFHHFVSKEQLYFEAMAGLLADLGELLFLAMEPPTFVVRLDRLGTLLGRYMGSHPEAARLLVRELVGHGAILPKKLQKTITQTLKTTAEFLKLGMDQGEIPRTDPAHLAMSLIGLHLMYWAAPGVGQIAARGDIFDADVVERRVASAVLHARRTCGVADA